ncbi:MAG: YceI family protein [Saprospiraceae bacterium]
MNIKLILGIGLLWLAFQVLPGNVAAQSSYNEITYEIPNAYYQAAGRSTQLSATVEYDDTTHVINSLEFDVPLHSFINIYGGNYNYIAAFGNAYNFPWLRFESNRIKDEGKTIEMRGTLYFRGEYRPVTIVAERTEKDEMLYLDSDFTISLREYFLLAPATVRIPPYLDMEFHLVFDLASPAVEDLNKAGTK